MENNRKEIVYNKIVDYSEDREITVLSGVFEYTDSFRGATGNKFIPISEEEIQDRISEYEGENMEFLKYMADNFGGVTSQMIDGIDTSREALIDFFFDQSYRELWDDIREELGLSEEEAVIFDCVGGGRCFDKDFQGNINPELSAIIREYESPLVENKL